MDDEDDEENKHDNNTSNRSSDSEDKAEDRNGRKNIPRAKIVKTFYKRPETETKENEEDQTTTNNKKNNNYDEEDKDMISEPNNEVIDSIVTVKLINEKICCKVIYKPRLDGSIPDEAFIETCKLPKIYHELLVDFYISKLKYV